MARTHIVNIPESSIRPFGVVGIPFVRPILDRTNIDASLIRLKGLLGGMGIEDIRESLEAAVIICGANTSQCQIRRVNPDYGYEHNMVYVLRYTLPGTRGYYTIAL